MEVVGVVAAIPGLIDLIRQTVTVVRACASKSELAKTTKGLEVQLQVLGDTLTGIETRWKAKTLQPARLAELKPLVNELRDELLGLQRLLDRATQKKGERGILHRAKLAFSGFDKDVKTQVRRLENLKSLLILKVADNIQEMVTDDARASKRAQIEGILQPCTTDFVPSKLPGTCEWIWTHPAVIKWLDIHPANHSDQSDRVLCIYGSKGCGKSVLSCSIANELKDRGHTVASFAFWTQCDTQKKVSQMLSTVLWQLLTSISSDRFDILAANITSCTDPTSTRSLLKLLGQAMSLITGPIYVVLDGLDESTDDWSSPMEGGLSVVRDWISQQVELRVLLLGRGPNLREAAKLYPSFEITPPLVQNDLAQVLQHCLDQATNIEGAELRQHVSAVLQTEETNMFLWLKLVFQELRQCFSPAEVRATLSSIPRSLDDEYRRLFRQIIVRSNGSHQLNFGNPPIQLERARRLFTLITSAAEPMSIQELRHAYAISCGSDGNWRDHLLAKDGILDVCGDLFQITRDRIHVCHSSLAEFLTRPEDQWPPNDVVNYFRIDPPEGHRLLGLACLSYLRTVEWGYPLLEDSFEKLHNENLFLDYAHRLAMFHVREAVTPRNNGLAKEVIAFYESVDFCKWVEYAVLHIAHDITSIAYILDLGEYVVSVELEACQIDRRPASLPTRIMIELTRRESAYGHGDLRAVTWKILCSFIPDFWAPAVSLTSVQSAYANSSTVESPAAKSSRQSAKQSTGLKYPAGQLAEITARSGTKLPIGLATNRGGFATTASSLLLLSKSLQLNIHPDWSKIYRRALLSFASRLLPVPIILIVMVLSNDDLELVQNLAEIAVTRTNGRRNLEQSVALGFHGAILADSGDEEGGKQRLEESLSILDQLPRHLLHDGFRLLVMNVLIGQLFGLGLVGDATKLAKEQAGFITHCNSFPAGLRLLWEGHIRKSTAWAGFKADVLTDTLLACPEIDNEALDAFATTIQQLQQALGQTSTAWSTMIELKWTYSQALHRNNRLEEATLQWLELREYLPAGHDKEFDVRRWILESHFAKRCGPDCTIDSAVEKVLLGEMKTLAENRPERLWFISWFSFLVLLTRGSLDAARQEAAKISFVVETAGILDADFRRSFRYFYYIQWQQSGSPGPTSFTAWLERSIEAACTGRDQGAANSIVSVRNLVMMACELSDLESVDVLDVLEESLRQCRKTWFRQRHGDIQTAIDLAELLEHVDNLPGAIEVYEQTIKGHSGDSAGPGKERGSDESSILPLQEALSLLRARATGVNGGSEGGEGCEEMQGANV